ncbi:MAG: glycosyltransferase family 9 protein [Thermodesulfobacteriota bacterium]
MESRKILILRLSAVGDVIRTLPAVKALKEYDPQSSITWVVEEPSKSLLESQPQIDEVILFPRRRWVEGIRSVRRIERTLAEMSRFISGLRGRNFDVVLDFHGILKSGLLSFLSGSPKRVGYDRRSTKEMNFLFSNVKVGLPKERISRFQRNLFLLRGVGLDVKKLEYRLHIPSEVRVEMESYFEARAASLRRPLIAIHPGTSSKTSFKRWMADRYASLADRLVRELKATVLFTWGTNELAWAEGIRKKMKESSILSPRTDSLTQLGEVYRNCDLYIGGDTGPMHVASLVGIPVVVIYGPTDPIANEPFGRHRKVREEVGCNPCRNRSCKKLTCLERVTVEDVFDAAKEILSATPHIPTDCERNFLNPSSSTYN